MTMPALRKALAVWSLLGGASLQTSPIVLQSPPVIQTMAGCFCPSFGSEPRTLHCGALTRLPGISILAQNGCCRSDRVRASSSITSSEGSIA